MANYTPPASLSTSYTTTAPTAAVQSDISPSAIDTLPTLAALLSRLHTTSPSNPSLNSASSPHASQSQTQTLIATQGSASSPSSHSLRDLNAPFSTTALTPKDIPAATDALKHRLQKTRLQVAQLPDMDRGLEEQEEEIRELEAKIAEQRHVLEALKMVGAHGMQS